MKLLQFFKDKSGRSKSAKGKTVVEYLPDADELERSPLPRVAQFTLQVLVLALISFGLWAAFSKIDLVVVAPGRLVNPLPNVVVQPLESGIVKTIEVRSGQVVKSGDVLATLDSTFAEADETQLRGRLESLSTQIQSLQQELSGHSTPDHVQSSSDDRLQANLANERRGNYRAQQLKLTENAGKLRAALNTNRQDQGLLQARLKSLKDMESIQEKMVAQKYGAQIQLLEAQQRTKEVERDLQLVRSREAELQRELAAFDAEKNAFERSWRQKTLEDLLNLTREHDALEQQLQKADKRTQLITLTAPIDAVVLEIAKLSPGSIVKEAETFFTLVPLNTKLQAEVQVGSMDVGYIKLGQPVRVKLDAFPFQKHGTVDAKINSISQDAFRRDPTNRSGADAYYLAKLSIDTGSLKNMGGKSQLLPGMTLTGEIVVGDRSIFSYLAWPITRGLDEAIREP
jgi:HlyD family secretion protein